MWNSQFALIIGIAISLTILTPAQSLASNQAEVIWQLVVISSEPACSGYHHYMVQKYNEITQKYLNLYQLENNNYEPMCLTERDFVEDYEKPYDLDLVILVFDKDKGISDLHAYNTGGIYMHQGNDLSTNHTVIICDCPNFKYSDPVWILSHELSHFVLNYLGFDLDVVEEEIHSLDYKFDSCVEGIYDNLCSTVTTKVETYSADWTVMVPYEPAIDKEPPKPLVEKVSLDTPYQTEMVLELTNWWIGEEISDENYINSLKILAGKTNDEKIIPNGIFQDSAFLILAEPQNHIKDETLYDEISTELTENIFNLDTSIIVKQTNFSSSDEKIFFEWLGTKALSWQTNEIDDVEFLSEIEVILDSSKVDLYLNYLENLTVDELFSKAIEFEKAGKYRNALSFYDLALVESLDSNQIEIKALIGKGSIHNALGQYDDALEYFDNALEIEPDNIDALKKKAFTLAQLGELEKARDYFQRAKQMELK